MEAPPNSLRCKTLVVSCTPGADNGEAAEVSAVLCVLPAERRLSLPKLKQALKAVDLRPVGLAAPQEAERLAGCSMGMVPPVCIEPKLPVYVDTRLFRGPRLVLGAAHEELHLAMSSRQLLLGTEGHVVDISLDSSAETPVATFPLRASSGSVVHVVAHIAAVRRLSRQLLFADLLPAGAALDAERSIWLSPDGSQRLVRLQLLVGRSLNERLGASGAAKVIKRLRPQQLIYVAGRLQLEEPGEQSGKVEPTAPEEVRKIREAQLTNGIVDMVAEQIRILEEVHVFSHESTGSARKVGAKKAAPPRAVSEEDPLRLALPSGAVHYVAEEEGLRHLEGVLRERLRGSADLDPGETVTPVLPVIGLDAEWRPNTEGIALLQLAFRRSVFLLDMLALTNDPQLRSRLETALLPVLEAEHVYKVGFGLEEDLHRLGRALEVSRARSVLDLRHLARLALPNTEVAPGLSGLVRQVFGRGLDKTCQVSDWQARPLKQEQLDYAAQDAHVCVRLFDSLCYNHATLATQSLAPALSGVAKAWPEDKAAKGAALRFPRGCAGIWRLLQWVASRHVGHWRYLAKAEGEFRIQLDERGALVLCLADASGVLLPQEKRWLQAELATASGEAAGVARVRFSEKTESMQYVLPMAEEPTAAYRVMSAQEAEGRFRASTIVNGTCSHDYRCGLSTMASDVASVDEVGRGPLWFACRLGRVEEVEKLLESRADLEQQDLLGWRALHLAACFGHKDVVQRLLAAKAQVGSRTRAGQTAGGLARRQGHTLPGLELEAVPRPRRAPAATEELRRCPEDGKMYSLASLIEAFAHERRLFTEEECKEYFLKEMQRLPEDHAAWQLPMLRFDGS
ncbi:unnamed protein product [Effrenium voratum]|nr:unnamed protein product [Effrenium voratum]